MLMTRTQFKLLFYLKEAGGRATAPDFDMMRARAGGNRRTVDALVFSGWLLFYPAGARGKGSYALSGAGDLAFADQYERWGDPE